MGTGKGTSKRGGRKRKASGWKRRNAITKGRSLSTGCANYVAESAGKISGSRASGSYKRHAGGVPRSVLGFGEI